MSIILDTETTGLIENTVLPLDLQPKIIEFGALKIDDKFNVIDEIQFMVNPGKSLPAIITKITGITDADLKDESPFVEYYGALCNFFLGSEKLIAHNAPFDVGMLKHDLMRIGKEFQFPWPQQHICTAEMSKGINNGKRLKLEQLWELATGKKPQQTHRAIDDCYMLLDCWKYLNETE